MMITSSVRNFFRDEDGPTAVEYAVMLALVLMAVIGAINSVGNSTSAMWQDNATQISEAMSKAS